MATHRKWSKLCTYKSVKFLFKKLQGWYKSLDTESCNNYALLKVVSVFEISIIANNTKNF